MTEEDLINLSKYNIYLKQLIDGMPSRVFSAATFAPNVKNDEAFQIRYNKILAVSREKYCNSRQEVEAKMNKMMQDVEVEEEQWEKKKEDFKNKKAEEKKKAHTALQSSQSSSSTAAEKAPIIKAPPPPPRPPLVVVKKTK
jgi:hypothetical protein